MRSTIGVLGAVLSLVGIWGCETLFGPGRACGQDRNIEVCTDRGEYRPGSTLLLTVVNRRSVVAFLDSCSVQIASTVGDVENLVGTYDPTRRCGLNVTPQEVLDSLIELAPGAEVTLEYSIATAAIQAFARSFVWVFDENVVLEPDPIGTSIFDVFPSAG